MTQPSGTHHDNAIRTGCAGWSLPRASWALFPPDGSHLERYAAVFNAVEINSSFYRPHQAATYARWAQSVPADFRFAVKMPKAITHVQRLGESNALLDDFLAQACGLGAKLGCVLTQLPPSLKFDADIAGRFLQSLRERYAGPVAMEPRHASWFTPEAEALLASFKVARVLADPVLHDGGERPGGHAGLVYLRLHGSPRVYYSAYEKPVLDALAVRLHESAAAGAAVWCVFDNTAAGAAVENALYTRAPTVRKD
ncbi:MAG: DUF72 domain-containing protein [Comamonadaceae bacterium]|nr:MAG: DUF72 domain-containing protein [Comamonadaceae bacterium]